MRLGGADRDRTDDIQLAKLALSQLSYGPSVLPRSLVGLERFELSTPRLSSVCSNQLSYRPLFLDLLLTHLFFKDLPVLQNETASILLPMWG
jgi:hypothetical protein